MEKRPRSPAYPYITLTRCLSLLEKAHRNHGIAADSFAPIDIDLLAEFLGLGSGKGIVLRYVATFMQFDLLCASGAGIDRRVAVTPVGRSAILDPQSGQTDTQARNYAREDAALNCRIISELYFGSSRVAAWGRNRPSGQQAVNQLNYDLGFTVNAAKKIVAVFDDALRYIQHVQSSRLEVADEAPKRLQENQFEFTVKPSGFVTINATLDLNGLNKLSEKIDSLKALLS